MANSSGELDVEVQIDGSQALEVLEPVLRCWASLLVPAPSAEGEPEYLTAFQNVVAQLPAALRKDWPEDSGTWKAISTWTTIVLGISRSLKLCGPLTGAACDPGRLHFRWNRCADDVRIQIRPDERGLVLRVFLSKVSRSNPLLAPIVEIIRAY